MPEMLPSAHSAVESRPSTSRGVDAPLPVHAFLHSLDVTGVSTPQESFTSGNVTPALPPGTSTPTSTSGTEASPSNLLRAPTPCSSLSSRASDDLTKEDCLLCLKKVALDMFPVAHDREIPKQHTVFATFKDLAEFKQLGGVDDKGVLAPEGKIIIKTVTSYLRDLKLHRYAEHFVECTRHSKTSTKGQLVKILPNQYPELKNLTAKIQTIASFIFTLNKNFDQPSRSSNVLTMTSDPARLRNAITSNVWLDLFKKGPLPNRGNGVFAMQRHTKGQVVIDNGGHYLSGKILCRL
ncbi:hypothetical protein LOTGIDRAFT_176667 [Lottia gigantea]|nr:hypothetical protein LOTGIDRAFT_176667 [Lottia gigantea]ESO95573.1 hypothetical protein LOTGIDRAFT_176667 [Lottia gigantea]